MNFTNINYCECGCGQIVKKKFVRGHHSKGKKCPHLARFGEDNPFYGKKHTKESLEKMRLASTGRIKSAETRAKISKIHKGKKFSEESKRKMSETKKRLFASGQLKNWNNGRHLPDWMKEKLSKKSKEWWTKPENRKLMKKKREVRPTSYEHRIINLIEKHNLPYKYCGDGSVWFGRCNPDFININCQKLIIEVYEEKLHDINYEEIRQKALGEFGYKVIFISGQELFRDDWESYCFNKIKGT